MPISMSRPLGSLEIDEACLNGEAYIYRHVKVEETSLIQIAKIRYLNLKICAIRS